MKHAVRRIDYGELPVDDFERFQKLHSTVFGWSFTDYGPEYRVFSDGNMKGGSYKPELKSRTENDASLIILFADNLEAIRDRVTEHGSSICKNIISFPGGRRFQFLDPHGNELGV